MPRLAELVQTTFDDAVIVELANNEEAMITGEMGGCVSAIVLWGATGGRYLRVRGHHASGGVQNINWPRLLAGAPVNSGDLHVVMAFSPSETSFSQKQISEAAIAATAALKPAHRTFAAHTNCYVDRSALIPTVREFDWVSEHNDFQIRRGNGRL